MPQDLIAQLQALYHDLEDVPDQYLQSIATDGIDADDMSVSYSSEGRRRVIGHLGTIRAMGRAIGRMKALADLLLEDEGPPIVVPSSLLREVVLRQRRDTLAEVKMEFDSLMKDAKAEHIGGLRGSSALVGLMLESTEDVRGVMASGVRSCVGCGCTDAQGCVEGCYWIGPNLCSRCVPAR